MKDRTIVTAAFIAVLLVATGIFLWFILGGTMKIDNFLSAFGTVVYIVTIGLDFIFWIVALKTLRKEKG